MKMFNPSSFVRLTLIFIAAIIFPVRSAPAEPGARHPARSLERQASDRTVEATRDGEPKPAAAGAIPDAAQKPVLTTNNVTIAGQRVRYVAEAGMLPVLGPEGAVQASIFYVSYTKQNDSLRRPRPVMFCFNGGPGSSSVWLHLGALGPRRVRLNGTDLTQPAPLGLVDNEFSILPVTDLVFIDPVGTGYSQAGKGSKPEQFFGEVPDIQAVGEFIRLWTTRHQRWLSPKYLCGESYGVIRAAGLAHHLHSRYGLTLDGLVFISGLLGEDAAALPGLSAGLHGGRRTFTGNCRPTFKPTCPRRWPSRGSSCGRSMPRPCSKAPR